MGESKTPTDSNQPVRSQRGPWQPLTRRGRAAFACGGSGWLLILQLFFALLSATTLAWSLQRAWFPVVETALAALPESGAEIRGQHLLWPRQESILLGSGPHLGLAVVTDPTTTLGQNGDLQLELRTGELRFRGLLGQISLPYPDRWLLSLDQTRAKAAWGAWRWPMVILLGLAAVPILMGLGWALSLAFAPLLWLMSLLFRRSLNPAGAWRLALASHLPASLLLDAGWILYAHQWIGLTSLTALLTLHGPVGWYAALRCLGFLPSSHTIAGNSAAPNPFENGVEKPNSKAATSKARNPFGS